jgi:ABC-type glycerol-3-phosphate transport system substrate-binding protein
MLPTRRCALTAAAALAGAALAACAPGPAAPERAQTFQGPVEVTFWDWFPDRTAYWEDQFRAVAQEHPQVKYSLGSRSPAS